MNTKNREWRRHFFEKNRKKRVDYGKKFRPRSSEIRVICTPDEILVDKLETADASCHRARANELHEFWDHLAQFITSSVISSCRHQPLVRHRHAPWHVPTSLFWLKSVARETNAVLVTLSGGIGGVCPAVGRQQEEIKVHPRLISPLIEDDDSVMINDWTLDMHTFLHRRWGKKT
ncbi:hypothetical protein CDAR_122591 [Caerostris darwini]|uniref:Uncharacterized protein n=1 Tax=Caerostris darwini TaxID=1538125 RepID=A0AAV4M9X9_9ARAC|nr:hypothetical protein CDAR_122591 [Caerostris darwini]